MMSTKPGVAKLPPVPKPETPLPAAFQGGFATDLGAISSGVRLVAVGESPEAAKAAGHETRQVQLRAVGTGAWATSRDGYDRAVEAKARLEKDPVFRRFTITIDTAPGMANIPIRRSGLANSPA